MTSISLITVSTNDVIVSLKDNINSTIIIETIKFNNHDINVYGTFDDPLFKAKDIGLLLEIERIRDTLKNIDEKDKILRPADTISGLKEQYFVTEFGLYEILFISRKPLAKEFKLYVKNILKDLRLNRFNILKTEYDNKLIEIENNKELEFIKAKNNQLLTEYENESGVYILLLEPSIIDESLYFNFGSTNNITRRMKEHKNEFKDKIPYLYLFYNTKHYLNMEQKIRNDYFISKNKIKYNNHNEMFVLNNNKNSQEYLNKLFKNIIKIIKEQFESMIDNSIELKKLEIKQEEEKTKQKELDFKILCLQMNQPQLINNIYNKNQEEPIIENIPVIIKEEIPKITKEPKKVKPIKIKNTLVIQTEKKRNSKKSKYIGVTFIEPSKSSNRKTTTYSSRIYYNKKSYYLGTYDTIEEAAYAYNCKAFELYGFEYENFNDIDLSKTHQFNNIINRLKLIHTTN